tara:strand:- start:177 stop:458 length:282 start_codon:yes stop_codon:yes gene_type:complete
VRRLWWKKKGNSLLFRVVSKKRFQTVLSLRLFCRKHVINIYTFRTSSNYTHCRYARASSFSLSAVVRANDVQEEEERSSSLSFFLSLLTPARA